MAKKAIDLVACGGSALDDEGMGRASSSPAVCSRRASRLRRRASIEKRAPIGKNKVQKQRMLMAQSPPFSVKISRSCRLTMHTNEITCMTLVCHPTVKAR